MQKNEKLKNKKIKGITYPELTINSLRYEKAKIDPTQNIKKGNNHKIFLNQFENEFFLKINFNLIINVS